MADPAGDKKPDFDAAALRAWGKALVKTGTEHLDLSMVRQGKKILADDTKATQPKK